LVPAANHNFEEYGDWKNKSSGGVAVDEAVNMN
jgi:hypothetical protein